MLARWMLRRLRTARDVARLAYRLHGRKTALIDRRGRFTYACLQTPTCPRCKPGW